MRNDVKDNVKRIALVWLTAVLVAACSPRGIPISSVTSSTLPANNGGTTLTPDQLGNMKVRLVARGGLIANDTHQSVQLVNGEYKSGADPGSPDFADVKLLDTPMAFGDLNGDGTSDAAVLLAENYGGTGVFVSVIAILNKDGQPVQAGASMIDDRPKVNLMAIQDGRILLSGDVHGPDDPGCCAAMPVSQVYALTPGGLVLRKFASTTSDGQQRVITIQGLPDGAQVLGTMLQVKGVYTVPPFENTLTYQVFDQAHTTLGAGTLPANDGAFEANVDLTGLPSGSPILLEITDLSAANSAPLAMDSVQLMIK